MCLVANETLFVEVVGAFVERGRPFTSLEVKEKLRATDPNTQYSQENVSGELRAMFNRGLLGKMVAAIRREPAVHIIYCLPSSRLLKTL